MTDVDVSKLPQFLTQRSWFEGKPWPIKNAVVLDHVELRFGPKATCLAIVEVSYGQGSPEHYLVAASADGQGPLRDVLDEPALRETLTGLVRDETVLHSAAGTLRGERAQPRGELPRGTLKLLRRLEAGASPELDAGRFLQRAGFSSTQALLGWLAFTGPGEATIALLHQETASAMNGWSHIRAALRVDPAVGASLQAELEELGATVAALHEALARPSEDEAFATEPVAENDLHCWGASLIGEIGVSLAQAADVVPELAQHRTSLSDKVRSLAHLSPSGRKMRLHGNLQLGSTLRSAGRWLITDIEADPEHSYARRREKHCCLRDVAAMLASISYAAAVLAREDEVCVDIGAARKAFLRGYWMSATGKAFVPDSEETRAGLLAAFELEKLLYELRHEIHHRPDRASIPARMLMEMAR